MTLIKRGEKMPKELNKRKKQILQAIVEEYIQTAEPVSSRSLVDNGKVDCSSATIRNENRYKYNSKNNR